MHGVYVSFYNDGNDGVISYHWEFGKKGVYRTSPFESAGRLTRLAMDLLDVEEVTQKIVLRSLDVNGLFQNGILVALSSI